MFNNLFKRKTSPVIALVVAIMSCVFSITPVYAEITTSGGSDSVPLVITAAATDMDVDLPLQLTFEVLSNATVVKAESGIAAVTNNSVSGGIVIDSVTTNGLNGYFLGAMTDDWTAKKVGLKSFAMQINTENIDPATGKPAMNSANWGGVIHANGGKLLINYDGKFPAFATAIEDQIIGQVVFVVKWDLAE